MSKQSTKVIDRTEQVRALIPKMPKHIGAFVAKMSGHQAHVLPGALVLEATVAASDLLGFWASTRADKKALADHGKYCSNPNVPGCFTSREGWAGLSGAGYAQEIEQPKELLKRLDAAREELAKTGLKEALQASAQGMRKRRRPCWHETDGDVDYERRFEERPFRGFTKVNKQFPFIEVIWPMGMNCTASAESLSLFNARCLALCEVLESCGYRVAITGEEWSQRTLGGTATAAKLFGRALSREAVKDVFRFPVRGADEYGDIASFSTLACVEFFRRAIFGGVLSTCHYVHGLEAEFGKPVDGGLGQSLDARPIPTEPGQLLLDHSTVSKLFTADAATREALFRDRIQHTIESHQEAPGAEAEAS